MSVASHREYIRSISFHNFKSLIYLLKSPRFVQTSKKRVRYWIVFPRSRLLRSKAKKWASLRNLDEEKMVPGNAGMFICMCWRAFLPIALSTHVAMMREDRIMSAVEQVQEQGSNILTDVVVRFAGDSGDGMQLTCLLYTSPSPRD